MGREIAVYFESWASRWVSSASVMDLASIDPKVTIVNIAFVRPDTGYYTGQFSWTNTGLQFSQEFRVVKDAISILRSRGVKVLLSVGGAAYPFAGYNAKACAALCSDLGCDGIDIDWEPTNGSNSDGEFGSIIESFYNALKAAPLYRFLSAACFSVGAYPTEVSGGYRGVNIKGIRSNGSQLDWINIMAYDAGPLSDYDPLVALNAYRTFYQGPLFTGFEVGTQGWGGALLTEEDVIRSATGTFKENSKNGVFVWSYLQTPSNTPNAKKVIELCASLVKNDVTTPTTPVVPVQPQPVGNFLKCPNCQKQLSLTLS